MDRRTLIKRAAAAGGVAWAAPMIVDSIASPAAAATGVYSVQFEHLGSSCAPVTPTADAGCQPAGFGEMVGSASCFGSIVCATPTATASLLLQDFSYDILGAVARTTDGCVVGTLTGGGAGVIFLGGTSPFTAFRIVSTCPA